MFQQYVVDQWAKVEQERLRYIKNNQATLRAETYRGIRDAFMREDVNTYRDSNQPGDLMANAMESATFSQLLSLAVLSICFVGIKMLWL